MGCSASLEEGEPSAADESVATSTQAICSNPPPPLLADISRGWPAGIIRYRFLGTATQEHVDAVRAKVTEWETRSAVIDFIEEPNNPAAFGINVADNNNGCVASNIPSNCLGKAAHELGHLLGLAHEQQRIDQGRFIKLVHNDDICDDNSEGTRYTDTIWSGTNYGPYNENSAMHYGINPGDPLRDSTVDFTRLDGTTAGLGGDGTVKDSDASMAREHQARQLRWDRFRTLGTDVGPGPLRPQLVSGVNLQSGAHLAAARVKRVDVSLVYGSNNAVYIASRGTRNSTWRQLFSSATTIAATTVGGELTVGRATSSGISIQRATNSQSLAGTQAAGDNAFMNAVTWGSAVNWGLPFSGAVISGFAMASTSASHLAVVARTSTNRLFLRNTSNLGAPTGSWTEIATGTSGRPALVAFGSGVRAYYATVSGGVWTLREKICTTGSSCSAATTVAIVQSGTTAAVTASSTELHALVRESTGRLSWRRLDVAGSFKPIGGLVTGEAAVTNSFEDRFGSFGVYAQLSDANLWHRTYNRYFQGRLSNLPPNDYDRDARSDFALYRDGDLLVRLSSGLPDVAFNGVGQVGDIFLPSADYTYDGVSDLRFFRPSDGTWRGFNVNRDQPGGTGNPTRISTFGALPSMAYGFGTDRPVPGDYDGDWITDPAVYRPTEGNWYASLSSTGAQQIIQFGVASDRQVPADYDGDGKTDPSVFRPTNNLWFVHPSAGGADIVQAFGTATDRLVPADYDGDGRADFAYFSPITGIWTIRFRTGEPDVAIAFGAATDHLAPGDYDGDGRADLAFYRPSTATFHLRPSSGGADILQILGSSTHFPVAPEAARTPNNAVNDVDRDLKSDLTYVRNGVFNLRRSSGGSNLAVSGIPTSALTLPIGDMDASRDPEIISFGSDGFWNLRTIDRNGTGSSLPALAFGTSTDIPTSGDYDGDGILDHAFYRPVGGNWHILPSTGGATIVVQFGGASGDKPIPADYDGDGRTDPAVYRTSNATFYAHPSGGGSDLFYTLGSATDRLVPADYDGDRRADFATFTSAGHWLIHPSAGGADLDFASGAAADRPVPSDYDADGRADRVVFRGAGQWLGQLSAGSSLSTVFGTTGDKLPWPAHIGNNP